MRAAPSLCLLAALAGCNFPDPDLRPAPPRRAAFGEAGLVLNLEADQDSVIVFGDSVLSRRGDLVLVGHGQLESITQSGLPHWESSPPETIARDPAISKDQRRFAWVSVDRLAADTRHPRIFVADSVSNPAQVLATDEMDCAHPAFSPDAASLVWQQVIDLGGRLWITNLETNLRTFVTEGTHPSWSPDGRWIAFESGTPPSIYKVRPDGTERTRLTDNRDARRPTWSPDSLWIAFGQFDADGHADDIWAVRADGSRFLRVTWDPAPEWDPCWAPDGRILFTTIRNGSQGIWAVAPENTELLK